MVAVDLPVLVAKAGHPVLEFCNTRAGWADPVPHEYLTSYAHLAEWARRHDLPTALSDAGGAAVLDRALAFRSALYAVLAGTSRPSDWAAVNAEVRRAAGAAELVPSAGVLPAVPRLPDSLGAELPLLAVVRACAELLVSPQADKVGVCPGVGCGWLFVNPHGKRRWCTMAICGNRAKARRHAARVRA
ncbi:MAG TPA: CGNR zinc finger domain-containing protein [Micromonosporaceae bacterium]|nr:CGNR zinc finger domain-containing protein [Micromonosporaceae bacterium]